MKCLFILLVFSLSLSAQKKGDKLHYENHVEAYYNKDSNLPIYIYESINGKIIDTLSNIDNKYSWYKIAILSSEYGWFKIKNIQRLPDDYKNFGYENHWVKTTGFLISVDKFGPSHRVYLYDAPSMASNRIHTIDDFHAVNVIETNDLWALVNLKAGKKIVSGWLNFKNQCAFPWTTCPKY